MTNSGAIWRMQFKRRCCRHADTQADKPIGKVARALPSYKRPLLSVDVVVGMYDILSIAANFTPPMQTSLLCATSCKSRGGMLPP